MIVNNKIGGIVLAASVVAATTWAGEVPCHDLSGEHGEGYRVVGYGAASKTWTILMQERLGHASIVMTMDRYGHLFPRGDDAAELAAAEKALLGSV
jgi:integrase